MVVPEDCCSVTDDVNTGTVQGSRETGGNIMRRDE